MVTLGALVREDCSIEPKARMGTIVKITDIVLHQDSQWEDEVARWRSYNRPNLEAGINTLEPDMSMCAVIRPGKVASVRWQGDPNRLTVHVFYDDIAHRSFFSYGSNGIEIVE